MGQGFVFVFLVFLSSSYWLVSWGSPFTDVLKNYIFSCCSVWVFNAVWNGRRDLKWWQSEKKMKISFVNEACPASLFRCLPAWGLPTSVIKRRDSRNGCQMIVISVLLFQPSPVWNSFRVLQLHLMPFLSNDRTWTSVVLMWAVETRTLCRCLFTR